MRKDDILHLFNCVPGGFNTRASNELNLLSSLELKFKIDFLSFFLPNALAAEVLSFVEVVCSEAAC